MAKVAEKLIKLKELLSGYGGAVVAFSGGADSTFLSCIAHTVLKDRVLAVTASSETYPEHEINAAVSLAQQFKLPHLLIHTEELADGKFAANPPERCYYCKKELFSRLLRVGAERGLPQVLDGTNYDDRHDFRPGMQAARELGIKSPLLEAELTKEEIRELSREMGIPTWNKPALPCLASRFPYWEAITIDKLSMVAEGESYLRTLCPNNLRLRHHGNLARIEVDREAFPVIMRNATEVCAALKQIGYTYITLDLQGFRSGSLNIGLQ